MSGLAGATSPDRSRTQLPTNSDQLEVSCVHINHDQAGPARNRLDTETTSPNLAKLSHATLPRGLPNNRSNPRAVLAMRRNGARPDRL